MSNSNDKCQQLRELHSRITEELRVLRENMEEEEREGVANTIETASIIISLQKALSSVDLELQKCPDTNEH
jgi:hypothetical protein